MWKRASSLMLAILLGASLALASAERPEMKIDVSGTWKWFTPRPNGGGREVTLKLRQQGETLTGTVSGLGGQSQIQDGSFKDGQVSFRVVRTRGGQETIITYNGQLNGDKLKGKYETEMRGQRVPRDWEARRVKEEEKN